MLAKRRFDSNFATGQSLASGFKVFPSGFVLVEAVCLESELQVSVAVLESILPLRFLERHNNCLFRGAYDRLENLLYCTSLVNGPADQTTSVSL